MKLATQLAASLALAAAVPAAVALTARPAAAAPSAADLAKDRAAAAEKVYRTALAQYQVGRITLDAVAGWSARWAEAAVDAAPKAAKQALADHGKRMQDLEAEVAKLVATGRVSTLDAEAAAYFRIEAELWVARGKR